MAEGYGFKVSDWVLVGIVGAAAYFIYKSGIFQNVGKITGAVGDLSSGIIGLPQQALNTLNQIPNDLISGAVSGATMPSFASQFGRDTLLGLSSPIYAPLALGDSLHAAVNMLGADYYAGKGMNPNPNNASDPVVATIAGKTYNPNIKSSNSSNVKVSIQAKDAVKPAPYVQGISDLPSVDLTGKKLPSIPKGGINVGGVNLGAGINP